MNFYFVAACVAIDSTKVRTNRTCAKAFSDSFSEWVRLPYSGHSFEQGQWSVKIK